MIEEVKTFLQEYERATNTHDFDNVRPLLTEDAVYFFSERTLRGIDQIDKAFVETWDKIQNERYSITDVEWIAISETQATCMYTFHWKGEVDGELQEGSGRGTNVIVKKEGAWKMAHEHLSTV